MTNKERILRTALELFANIGYAATPTSQIARMAKVSEGLLFSHYGSKQGLLDAIVQAAEKKLAMGIQPILQCDEPEQIVKMTIELPYQIPEDEYDFWRLQFKLKWDVNYYNPEKLKPLTDRLNLAFTKLDYPQPQLEAKFLTDMLETISANILRDGKSGQLPYKKFLLNKYQIRDSR